MPIGKNSIKRVKNNGYSSVKTSAPDMENSTVLANPSPEVIEKMIPSASTKKKGDKKASSVKKNAPVSKKETSTKKNTTSKKVNNNLQITNKTESVNEKEDGFVRFSLGAELPTYLL